MDTAIRRLAPFALALTVSAVFCLAAAPARAGKLDDAVAAFADFRDREALTLLDEVIAENPGDTPLLAMAYFNRGEVQLWRRRTDEALADFTTALSMQTEPEQKAQTLISRAEAYVRKEMFPEAFKDYDASLALVPDQIGVYTARGRLHERLGDKTAALADFDAELKLHPKHHYAMSARALILGLPIPAEAVYEIRR